MRSFYRTRIRALLRVELCYSLESEPESDEEDLTDGIFSPQFVHSTGVQCGAQSDRTVIDPHTIEILRHACCAFLLFEAST